MARHRNLVPLMLAAFVGCTTAAPPEAPSLRDTDDADGDTILNYHEAPLIASAEPWDVADADGDGIPNYLDEDSDGDGLPDALEAGDDDPLTPPVDTDGDGLPDFLDVDSDGNCLPDVDEAGPGPHMLYDFDLDGVPDYLDPDNDGDGLPDRVELAPDPSAAELGCALVDTDGDGIADHLDEDSDGDCVADRYESSSPNVIGGPVDTDGDGIWDFRDLDSDGDGLLDADELGARCLEVPRDTDGDGIPDFQDLDSDGDGLDDADEAGVHGTDPYDADTDGDGFVDGLEVALASDPSDPESKPGAFRMLDPQAPSVAEVAVPVGPSRVDVVTLFDAKHINGAMSLVSHGFRSDVAEPLAAQHADLAFSFGYFADYSDGGGWLGARPFWLGSRLTSDLAFAWDRSAPQFRPTSGTFESTAIEAIFQAATGRGYDWACDGVFDEQRDVRPFFASSDDAFGGTVEGASEAEGPWVGELGGVGLRDDALKVFLVYAENLQRHPDSETAVPTPAGCPGDATLAEAADAVRALDGWVIGLDVAERGEGAIDTLVELAERGEFVLDLDGSGEPQPLAFAAQGDAYTKRSQASAFAQQAIARIAGVWRGSRVAITVDDPGGVVASRSPASVAVGPETLASFPVGVTLNLRRAPTPTARWQVHVVTIRLRSEEGRPLSEREVTFVVPPASGRD